MRAGDSHPPSRDLALTLVLNILIKSFPDFDSRGYGYHKLSDLIIATSKVEARRRSPPKGAKEETYVRDKHRKINSSANRVF